MKTVACVGSQATPPAVLSWMEETGEALVRGGYDIRSGNAPGADQAWARGANKIDPSRVTLCLPWDSFETAAIHGRNIVQVWRSANEKRFVEIVAETHPNFVRLSPSGIALHSRNAMIVDGSYLVLGYVNPNKPGGGGTGGAFRIAHRWKIITMNVADAFVRETITKRLAIGDDVRGPVWETGKGKKW